MNRKSFADQLFRQNQYVLGNRFRTTEHALPYEDFAPRTVTEKWEPEYAGSSVRMSGGVPVKPTPNTAGWIRCAG